MVSKDTDEGLGKKPTDHQVETEFVGESIGTRSLELGFDFKPTGCENDGKREPKSAVGRERGCTESISDRHLPAHQRLAFQLTASALDRQ